MSEASPQTSCSDFCELNALEKQLGTSSGRMLAGIGVRFGKDSSEYEMAGGVRTSEIKRGGKKEKPEK